MTNPEEPADQEAPVKPDRPFAKSWAVVIGINKYSNGIPPLTTAVADAKSIADTLQKVHRYNEIRLRTDEEASQGGLTALLETELPGKVGENDCVFFYWAGHGVAHQSDKGPNGYLLPSDGSLGKESTYLRMTDVHKWLTGLKCRHMLIVLDSCFSGAFKWSGTRDVVQVDEVINLQKYYRYVGHPAWQVITSASQDQKALDQFSASSRGAGEKDDHSPFAQRLLEALEGDAADYTGPEGEKQGDGVVTASELHLYLSQKVQTAAEDAGARQVPMLWELPQHEGGQFIFFVNGQIPSIKKAPRLKEEDNPWRGLSSYEVDQGDLFFGRDKQIRALRAHVEAHPLTVVLGASGTGKSSLVRAGLIRELVSDAGWQVLHSTEPKRDKKDGNKTVYGMRPGARPFEALLRMIHPMYDPKVLRMSTVHAVRTAQRATVLDDIKEHVRKLLAEDDRKTVALVIDRLEELITLSRSDVRDDFLGLLAELLKQHDRLRVIVTVRSDFEPSFLLTGMRDRWEESIFRVEPMSRDDLRAVIELPAKQRVMYFTPPKLVEELIADVDATPGALPLLSFALSQLYVTYYNRIKDDQAAGKIVDRAITAADYSALGGVVGALRRKADEVYDYPLGDPGQSGTGPESPEQIDAARDTLRHIMLRMVVREGGNLAGRRVTKEELDFPGEEANALREKVVDRLEKAGLLVRGSEQKAGLLVQGREHDEEFVEPAHDALIREWGKLQTWVAELDEEAKAAARARRTGMRGMAHRLFDWVDEAWPNTLEQRQRLARAAGEWADAADKKAKAGLVWGDRVRSAQLESLVTARTSWLNRREVAFAERSIHRRGQTVAWRNTVLLVIVLLAFTSIAFGVRATVLAALATSRQLAAETRTALANGNLDLAALLAVEAAALPAPDKVSPLLTWQLTTPKLRGYLRDTVPVTAVGLSPDGNTIATAQAPDTTVPDTGGWRVRTKMFWLRLNGRLGNTRSQTPPPKQCKDKEVSTIVLWQVASRTYSDTLCAHGGRVVSLAYGGPDSTPTLAAGFARGSVRIFDVPKRQSDTLPFQQAQDTRPGGATQVTALAFGAGGRILALAKDNRIILWDVRGSGLVGGRKNRNPDEPPKPHPGKEIEDTAASAPLNAPPRSRIIDSLIEGKSPIRSLVFSPTSNPDTQTLASVTDGGVTMWRITHQTEIVQKGETLDSIARGNSKRWRKIYQWNRSVWFTQPHWIYPGDTLDMGFETRKLRSLPDTNAVGLAFSPDGGTFAVARKDSTLILRNVATWQARDTLRGLTGGAVSVAFRPGAKDKPTILAAGTAAGTVLLWDVTRMGHPRRISEPLHGHADAVSSLAFGADGQTLVSTSEDGQVVVWGLAPRPPRSDSAGLRVTLMTGQADGTVRVWDVSRTQKPTPLDSTRGAFGIAFSPVPGAMADIVLRNPGPLPHGAFSVTRSSADSNTLAAVYADSTAILWNIAQQRGSPRSSPLGGGGVTSVAFSPRRGSLASAHADGTVILWRVEQDSGPTQIRTLLRRGSGAATSVAFSPDSSTIASAYQDGTIVRWSLSSGRRLGGTRRQTNMVRSLAYSADGRTLASASIDSSVILWDVENMRRRGEPLRGLFRSLAFSPDNTSLAAVSDSGRVTFWDFRLESMKRAACDAAGRNLSNPEWGETFRKRYERACSEYPGLSPVSGEGWWERDVSSAVLGLANSPRLLEFLGNTWMWIWLPILVPWFLLWRKGRRVRHSSRSAA